MTSVQATLSRRFRLRAESPRVLDQTFFDTVDWRLHRAGLTLEQRLSAAGNELRCYQTADGTLLARATFNGAVRFVRDLLPGTLRERLEPVTGVRALVPVVRSESSIETLSVLDGEGKTLARLDFEHGYVSDDSRGQLIALPALLRLTPVRGYESFAEQINAFIGQEYKLPPYPADPLVPALAAIGRRPGASPKEPGVRMEWSTPAATAMRHVHRLLLASMLHNEPGVRADLDSEFLHDFRVAVRRSRSSLGQVKGVFPAPVVERFRTEFAWLGQLTSSTRDLDVYLLQFDDYRLAVPPSMRADLEPLRVLIGLRQRAEHDALISALDSPRYASFVQDWEQFLRQEAANDEAPPNALQPIGLVATRRIERVLRSVVKESRTIDRRATAEQFHDLRKSSKKLRYLIESFRTLYPDDELVRPLAEARRLQEVLGRFQDLQVQRASLSDFAGELEHDSRVPRATLLALGALDSHLHRRQLRAEARLLPAIEHFLARRTQHHFRQLVRKRPAIVESSTTDGATDEGNQVS